MEYWILYLCSIADSFNTFCMTIGIIGLVISAIIFIMSICSAQCEHCSCDVCIAKGVRKAGIRVKHVLIPSLIILLLGIFTPSTKACYAIFGVGTTLNYISNSEEVQQLPDNAVKALNRYLESITPIDSIK